MKSQRSKFSLPSGITYINCGYMSPMLKSVERAAIKGMRQKRNPLTIKPADFFEGGELLRKTFSKVISNKQTNRIAIIPSASYGLANVAHNVKMSAGEEIIVTGEQFPSNYYPWQRLCADNKARLVTVSAPDTTQSRGKIWNERLLEAITPKTRMVAIGNVHWADGTRFDLRSIRKRLDEVGGLLIIDGTQSVGALPFDVQQVRPDALVCAGYKWLMGPYSIGLAYYGSYFDNGLPIEESWMNRFKSEDFAGLVNYNEDYQPGALRYDVGEHSNFILAPMMQAALEQIIKWGPANIQSYCKSISTNAVRKLKDNDFWVEDDAFRGHHLFGIRMPVHANIKAIKEKLQRHKIAVSFRGNAIRVSPHVYNTSKDLDKLSDLLLTAVHGA